MSGHGNYQATLAEKLSNPAPRHLLINPHASAIEQDRQQKALNEWYWQAAQRRAARVARSMHHSSEFA